MILFVIPMMRMEHGGEMDPTTMVTMMSVYVLVPAASVLVMAVQTLFFYSWVLVAEGYGAWESVTMSYEKVRGNYWSYLGMFLAPDATCADRDVCVLRGDACDPAAAAVRAGGCVYVAFQAPGLTQQ